MRKLSKFRYLSVLTLFFFFTSLFLPYAAMAFDEQPWHAGGQPIGGPTNVGGAPQDGQPQQPGKNGAGCGGDPVYLHSGEYFYNCVDLAIPGRGLDVEITHRYNSGSAFNNQFGYGWVINYYYRLKVQDNGNVLVVSGDGRNDEYTGNGDGTYTAPAGFFETLVENADGTWTLTKAQGEKDTFDLNGNLSSMADRNDNQITFTYDPAGLLPVIGVSPFTQNPDERVVIGYDYRLTQITDTVGRSINFAYNADGRLETITDYAGRVVRFGYDPLTDDLLSRTKPVTAQYPSGVTETYSYTDHRLETMKDARGQTFMVNRYDAANKVVEQDYGEGTYRLSYATNEATETDRKGFVTKHTLNDKGNILRKEEFTKGLRGDDPASFVTTYTYNADMLRTAVTFPKGNGIKFVYDETNTDHRARGNLKEVRRKTSMAAPDNDTNDIVIRVTYENRFNSPKTITDPQGNLYTYIYDYELSPTDPDYGENGNLVSIRYPAVPSGTPYVSLSYNDYGQVTQVRDPNGNIVQYDYFPATGYLKQIKQDPTGINAVTQVTWDPYGTIDTITDANNHTTNYDFDALGWLNKVTNPLTYVTKYTYDANGNVSKIERQANEGGTQWQTVNLAYDILNHLKTIADPLSRVTTLEYDASENLESVLDAESNTTSYVYDERDLLFKITDANTPKGTTQYDYDTNGNLKKINDANNHATQYAFDLFDRLQTMTYANNSFEQYTYDKNSNLDLVTTPSTKQIDYVYDALNRLTAKRYPLNASLDASYTYDLGSRLTDADIAAAGGAKNHFTYDKLNRIDLNTQVLPGGTYVLDYDFDKVGNRTKITYPSGKVVEYVPDANDRMDKVKVNAAAMANFDYDPLDRRTVKDYLPGVKQQTTYQFDMANQLKNLTNKFTAGGNISQYDYTSYDNVGNRLTQQLIQGGNPVKTANYGYNDIYELETVSGAQTHTYDYDNVGSRLTADGVAYVPNNLNQYNSVGGVSYSYDLNGNLTANGTNAYTYDEENRLSSVFGLHSSVYAYDAFSRRVSKKVDGLTTYFISDGAREIAEYNASGQLQAEYVHGDYIDEVLAMSRAGKNYYYHYDGLGSVSDLTDDQGNVVERYTYDVYGQPSRLSSVGNPFLFTGRRFDDESGLYYYRLRMYSPTIGRFLQRDPIGYWDGMNLFEYVFNSPNNWTDAFGLGVGFDDIKDFAENTLHIGGPGSLAGKIIFGYIGQKAGGQLFGNAGLQIGMRVGGYLGLGAGPLGSLAGAFVGGIVGQWLGKLGGGYLGEELGGKIGGLFDDPCAGLANCNEPPIDPNDLMCEADPMCTEDNNSDKCK